MSPQEIREVLSYIGAFGVGGLIAGAIVYLLLKSFVPAYLSKKAENLATHEDIAAITEEMERVRTQYAIVVEELKARHQLRMAAVDRRLQAHQEAFAHWCNLRNSVHTSEVHAEVGKCQTWWNENCLYLEPTVREAFVASYTAANTHSSLLNARAEAGFVTASWSEVMGVPNLIFAATQLPPLTEIEAKSFSRNHATNREADG
jgi:hypothetical protein